MKANMTMNALTLTFADSADKAGFLQYVAKAKAQDGTISGLYAGIVCSALKRAQVGESAAPDLLAALEECLAQLDGFASAGIAANQLSKSARLAAEFGAKLKLIPAAKQARAAIAAAKGA